MNKKITIAIDAMGGENAPEKNIEGLSIFFRKTQPKDLVVNLYGDERILKEQLIKHKILNKSVNIIHTDSIVSDEETPLTAIKNSKNTSMWNSVRAQIDGEADISLSAGNTGVLLVISRMILKTAPNCIKVDL